MPEVRSGPLVGLAGQFVLLAVLATTVGLGPPGWLVGGGYAVVLAAALTRGMVRAGVPAFGPADRVTSARAVLVGGVAALTADAPSRATPVAVLVALAGVALALDGVDGWVARRTGTASALGARFDMEVDAFLILVLSVYLVVDGRVAGPAAGGVLAIGAMRYGFGAAGWALPWLRGALPPRYWRKVVAATQGVVLVVVAAGVLPRPVALAVLTGALALLVESFGRDVGWLWRRRPTRRRGPVRSAVVARSGTVVVRSGSG